LQEHSYSSKADPNSTDANKNFDPANKADLTKEYARKFDEEIKKIKAKGVIYQNWALQKTPDDQPAITKIYEEISKELGSLVVPVAQARLNAVKADPTQNFFVKDGKHPTQAGTYLAACTFFKALTGKSSKNTVTKITDPKDPKKVLCDLTADQAAFLQKMADEAVR
jgi:malate synthase